MAKFAFASAKCRREWGSSLVHPLVREIAAFIAIQRWERMAEPSVITSVFREGDKGPHGSWRAVDLDADERRLDEEEVIREMVLTRWPTGIKKMPRVPPLVHGTGPHFHVQITVAEASSSAAQTETETGR